MSTTLIGTAPDQVPTNQLLGELAFMNADAAIFRPASSANPQMPGLMCFQLTSNTSLTIKVMGSDGVVRSASLTLA